MAAKNITLAGKRFVILPAEEYRRLRQRAGTPRPRRAAAQQHADTAEALRRLVDPADKAVPYMEARKRLGLK